MTDMIEELKKAMKEGELSINLSEEIILALVKAIETLRVIRLTHPDYDSTVSIETEKLRRMAADALIAVDKTINGILGEKRT